MRKLEPLAYLAGAVLCASMLYGLVWLSRWMVELRP